MKKYFSALLILACASVAAAQTYRVSVETYVGNKLEDKFSFTLEQGEKQMKGFDGKLLAKRYRAKGYQHSQILKKALEFDEDKRQESQSALKPAERVRSLLEAARKDFDMAEKRLTSCQTSKEVAEGKLRELEELDALASRGSTSFKNAYEQYVKKNELTEEDIKFKKLVRRLPEDTGDVEKIDFGSFCRMKITKAADKKVTLAMDYCYSRIMTFFYADGNNNGNTVTKQPVVERFEKLGIKNLTLTVGAPYCIQFTRPSPDEAASSLAEAMAKTSVFGGKSPEEVAPLKAEKKPLDDQGLLSDIKRKYASQVGKVARAVITVKFER